MKFVALVSGGKDSIFSILEAQRVGHELVACVHLGRPVAETSGTSTGTTDKEEEQEESYMYQTAGSEAVRTIVEDCIQVPLIHYVRQGKSVQTSLVYQHDDSNTNNNTNNNTPPSTPENIQDEVEDLYLALREAVHRFPDIQAVASGALLSTYQRVRIEHVVCQRLGLTSLSYLWRRGSQHDTLRAMLHEAHLDVVVVRTAAPPGLVPRRHLGQSLAALEPTLDRLYNQYGVHVCGEGGEYESLCLYAPGLYRKRLVLDDVQVCLDPSDDGVGDLWIKACHAADLDPDENNMHPLVPAPSPTRVTPQTPSGSAASSKSPSPSASLDTWQPPPVTWLPHVCRVEGGFWHTSGMVSPKYYPPDPNMDEKDLAVQEARDVFFLLQSLLEAHRCTAYDVGMVHLYLSDMSHFASINQYYQKCFGVLLPPSRSCVALGRCNLPRHRRVMLDCWVLAGSGEYLRRQGTTDDSHQHPVTSPYASAALVNTTQSYRNVLHVQSRSHWAPVCVGPYSQANTLLGALHFLAGSIGLWPATMTLRDTWEAQLQQSWKNLAQILDALDQSSLSQHVLSGMVYIADTVYAQNPTEAVARIMDISREQISLNGKVIPGLIDDLVKAEPQEAHGGYEDEETRIAMEGNAADFDTEEELGRPICPVLIVSIPAMPVGAQVEVEIIAAASTAAVCLPIADHRQSWRPTPKDERLTQSGWSCGYDFDEWDTKPERTKPQEKYFWSIRCLGVTGAAFATVAVEWGDKVCLNLETTMASMIRSLAAACSQTRGTVSMEHLVHIRLYYLSVDVLHDEAVVLDMSSRLEVALVSALPKNSRPAVTIVPVHGMHYVELDGNIQTKIRLALQASFLDPVSVQTELWIRKGRPSE